MRAEVGAGTDPAHMAPQEPVPPGRMHVHRFVAVAMVAAMMGGPPQRSALHRARSQQREAELRRARGLEGAVAEVAVVEAGDGEHPHDIERHRPTDGERGPAGPKDGEAGEVQQRERQHPHPVDALRRLGRRRLHAGPRVEPADQREERSGRPGLGGGVAHRARRADGRSPRPRPLTGGGRGSGTPSIPAHHDSSRAPRTP